MTSKSYPPNWRELCAELVDALACHYPGHVDDDELVNRVRAALADEPAVPEGREPVAVTRQPSDEELLATLDHATASFPPRHPDAEALNAVEYPLALELRKARAVLARWGNPAPVPPADGEMAKLVAKLRRLAPQNPLGTADPTISRAADLLSEDDARAALSQPVPEVVEPSLEEVEDLCEEHCFNVEGYESIECLQGLINDALARWGRPTPPAEGEVGELVSVLGFIRLDVPPCDGAKISRAADLLSIAYATGPEVWEPIPLLPARRHPAPVPVAERPWEREGWCDEEGRCWCFFDNSSERGWQYRRPQPSFYDTHCLPHYALPLPAGEVEHG